MFFEAWWTVTDERQGEFPETEVVLRKFDMTHLETPCIVVDYEQCMRNIQKVQHIADRNGCRLRPHIKTHKSIYWAKKQIEAGASGITCAKVSEAEVMASGGIDDIFIAYPVVGEFRVRRAAALNRQIRRLIVGVDSAEGAQTLSKEAVKSGKILEVRVEVDTGAKRTGESPDRVLSLARQICRLPGLNLAGIYTFKGLVCNNKVTTDAKAAGREEGQLMHDVYEQLKANGIAVSDISAGSTPTGEAVAETGMVNEIRPGTYIFYDYMCYREGACKPDEIAASMVATVVSTPSPEYAVIDGGTKTFPTDVPLNAPPYYFPAYAITEGNDDLLLTRMNEEHGMLTSKRGNTGLRIGRELRLIPLHICTAINLQNRFYLWKNGTMTECKVDARGMLV